MSSLGPPSAREMKRLEEPKTWFGKEDGLETTPSLELFYDPMHFRSGFARDCDVQQTTFRSFCIEQCIVVYFTG